MNRRFQMAGGLALATIAAGVFAFLTISPSFNGQAVAFADVQEATARVRSVTYRGLSYKGEEVSEWGSLMAIGTNLLRVERPGGEVLVINLKEGRTMRILPKEKKVEIRPLYGGPDAAKPLTDFLTQLRDVPAHAARKISEKDLQGRQVIEFALEDQSGCELSVLVDAKTKLPVRIEVDRGREGRFVGTDFVFDAPLDESLFAIAAPEGYTVDGYEPRPPAARDQSSVAPPVASDQSLVVSPDSGIGSAKFGMTTAQVIKHLGKPDHIKRSEPRAAKLPKGEKPIDEEYPEQVGGTINVNSKLTELTAEVKLPKGANPTYEEEVKEGTINVNSESPDPTIDEELLLKQVKGQTLETLIYDSRGFSIHVNSKYGMSSIHCTSNAHGGPTARDFQGKTKEGIRIGASWEDVLETYGQPDAKHEKSSLHYYTLEMHFGFHDGKLAWIDVSPPPMKGVEIEVIQLEDGRVFKWQRFRPRSDE